MPMLTLLNILSASIGLMSALFFASGMIRMTAEDVWHSATAKWDINGHLVSSIAYQRAEYIVGAILLLLSFALQMLATLFPSAAEPSLLQPFGCAIAEIVAVVAVFLVCSYIARGALSKSTISKVQRIQKAWEDKELREENNRQSS